MSLYRNTGYKSGYDTYKSNEVSTQSPAKLIVMLYDGAIRFLKTASDNMNYKNFDVVNNNINRAHDIVDELISSLNVEEGGEVAQNLLSLYIYINKRIIEANVNKDREIISEVIHILGELKTAWEEILRKEGSLSSKTPVTPGKTGFSIQG
ncbi:MAG: flagellar export chaperone FliS [Leptospiraceae bacterium]|nr:flagellar export chaperone FliS [Leptospiraceae bacterium]MCP5499834.1 flagellar export chaperone FliS [Leptospiraceae bacterium]